MLTGYFIYPLQMFAFSIRSLHHVLFKFKAIPRNKIKLVLQNKRHLQSVSLCYLHKPGSPS